MPGGTAFHCYLIVCTFDLYLGSVHAKPNILRNMFNIYISSIVIPATARNLNSFLTQLFANPAIDKSAKL